MYIVIEYGIPCIVEKLPAFQLNRLAILKSTWENCRAFDAESRYEARPSETPSFSLLQRLLARTIYNPQTNVEIGWQVAGEYSLPEVVAEVEKGLENDDDIIQQWFDAGDVLKLLRSASTFSELVDRINCVRGGFECEPRLQKIVEDVIGPT